MMEGLMMRLRQPRLWLAVAAIAAVVGVAMGSGWLTAGALLSLLVALAPCLLMCALGLCMRHGSGKGCKSSGDTGDGSATKLGTREL